MRKGMIAEEAVGNEEFDLAGCGRGTEERRGKRGARELEAKLDLREAFERGDERGKRRLKDWLFFLFFL